MIMIITSLSTPAIIIIVITKLWPSMIITTMIITMIITMFTWMYCSSRVTLWTLARAALMFLLHSKLIRVDFPEFDWSS